MPFLGGRGQASRGYFGGGTTPDAPSLGTITTSINSPNTVSTPSMTQDENNASFSWSNPGAGGVTLSVPFTAPAFNGGLAITDYEYSTDNGSTFKSSGSTTSPISITTVSSSSSNLAAATSYTVKLRAVNALGSGAASSGSAQTTPTAVTSYTIQVFNNRGVEALADTVSGNTTTSYSKSHYHLEKDWSVKVSAVNAGGNGSYSDESPAATGWTLTSCSNTDSSGCAGCGTKTTVCSQMTRTFGGVTSTAGPCNVSCQAQSGCSPTWTLSTGNFSYEGRSYTYSGSPGAYYYVYDFAGSNPPPATCAPCPYDGGCYAIAQITAEYCPGEVTRRLTTVDCGLPCLYYFDGLPCY